MKTPGPADRDYSSTHASTETVPLLARRQVSLPQKAHHPLEPSIHYCSFSKPSNYSPTLTMILPIQHDDIEEMDFGGSNVKAREGEYFVLNSKGGLR